MAQNITINNVPDIVAHQLGADTAKKGVTQDQNAAYLLAKALGSAANAPITTTLNKDKWTNF